MKSERSSGILLHPSSLPGPNGIGDLGPEAYHWLNFLYDSGCSLWQILPLGPTGYGDSPYQCFSAFAGNPYLISPTLLLNDSLLTSQDLTGKPAFPDEKVQFEGVAPWKLALLDKAFDRFQTHNVPDLQVEFENFKAEEKLWLDDFALFMSIKESCGGASWSHWPEPLRKRKTKALATFQSQHAPTIEKHRFRQFLFFRQWKSLREYAAGKGIRIIGDIPIFISYDSADAWSHPELFTLNSQGLPTVVAGVPPDYFSPTGQLWGNPLYRWEEHQKTGYDWWIKRFQSSLKIADIIRLDHFRGFAGYWEIPAGMPTAEKGRWLPGPGKDFLSSIQKALNGLPIIAEDLGEITPDVVELRESFQLPGMKILQFAFSTTPQNPFLPHNYPCNCVAYTGTHDNDTTIGWYETAPEAERDFCRRYLSSSGTEIAWDMIRAVWSSVANTTLAPLQDFLNLGSQARMNFPGKPQGNWTWRMPPGALTPHLVDRIRELNFLFDRLNPPSASLP